jgi:hypothetical protein
MIRSSLTRDRGFAKTPLLSLLASGFIASVTGISLASGSEVRFQRPNFYKPGGVDSAQTAFERAQPPREQRALKPAPQQAPVQRQRPAVVQANSLRASREAETPARPMASAPQARPVDQFAAAAAFREERPSFLSAQSELSDAAPQYDESQVVQAGYHRRSIVPPFLRGHAVQIGDCAGCDVGCGVPEPECGVAEPVCGLPEPVCGMPEPGCGIVEEPMCGMAEPGCGVYEDPSCGIVEPGCGLAEPSCGVADVGCGTCVGRPGPDYWCFPVCLPRFKELSIWGGVQGFKGPRDSPTFGGDGDGSFGFNEGFNIGGRAPLIGLLFPQLGYEVGYRAVQSQLSGTSGGSALDRSQDFVTIGLFRRVPAGLQFGAAWDYQHDDFMGFDADFNQIRYEVSIKGRLGREFGFWGATHTNDQTLGGTTFQTVDQYAGFFRWNFREGGMARAWFGGTNDSETLFGADFYAPFNNRWSLQSGFNYLITDLDSGRNGAREESWNIGVNLAWHYGCTAKMTRYNPFMPLFTTADNGWMFVDQKP